MVDKWKFFVDGDHTVILYASDDLTNQIYTVDIDLNDLVFYDQIEQECVLDFGTVIGTSIGTAEDFEKTVDLHRMHSIMGV